MLSLRRRRPLRVLSIDGGGIRGLVPALLLERLEGAAGRPVYQLFDLIAGTSTGAIIALGLTRPEGPMKAAEIADVYKKHGAQIFPPGKIRQIPSLREGYRYEPGALKAVARRYLGEDTWLSECVGDVVVPTYDLSRRGPRVLRSKDAREDRDRDFRLSDVVVAACAAPTYFPPGQVESRMGSERTLVDGGIFVNNPTMLAIGDLWVDSKRGLVVVSLGTGDTTLPWAADEVVQPAHPLDSARRVLSMAMDGGSAVAHEQAEAICGRYHRFDLSLPRKCENLDDASSANLSELEEAARQLIEASEARFQTVARELVN